MEYIMINESKLKVICEESDLDPYGICADSLEYGDAYSRKFLEDLLDEAKVRFGFDTARHRVLIQLFPDNEGGCEIFINKLGLLEKQSCDTKKQEYHVAHAKSRFNAK
jgi:negative regulator of genetic competence, sporulation and motility